MKNAKGWFSIGKLKDKKNKPPKDKAKDPEKEKKDALYENFLKDPKQKKQKNENEFDATKSTQNSDNDNGKNNNNANKNKKPKSKNDQQQKKTIEQMIQEDLDEKEFSDLITNIKEKYPNSSTAWLFEAAFYLNNKIPSNVKDVLNVFNSSIVNYPLNIMKDTFKKQLNELFKTFTKQELYQIQLTIIETIIPNIYLTGSVSGPVGYLLFLMQLSIYLEQNTAENIDRLASPAVRNKNKEKPNVYLTQIFCLQSIGYYNLKEGLDVWKKLYSPVLDHKYFYQFGLKYLNQILELNKDAYGIIDVKDLIRILKLKAASEHQEILEKILPKLKLLILQNQTDNEIKNSFNELISNLNSFKNENQLEEFIVNCLVYCLDKSRSCFDIWFEYHKTSGSNNKDLLLDYLIANPNSIQKEKKAYRSTLQKIAKFNDKQGQTNYQSKEILKTMGNSSKCRINFAFLMLTALLVYVAYDFKINGSFERSNTARYLKRWKVYNYVQPVAINIERNVLILKKQYDVKYAPTVNSYVDQIAKKYDTNIRPTVDPYLDQLYTVSKPYVNSLIENSILAYRAVEKYYLNYTRQLVIYLEKNVFTGSLSIDNIKIVLNDTFEKFLKAYGDAYKWANDKISALIKS